MTPRPRFDREYIRREFETIATDLQTDVTVFLVGGGAMSFRDLKDTTKDIDLVVTSTEEYERFLGTLTEMGYEEVTDLGDEYEQLGARHCVKNDDGCQIDLFYKQIADKLFFSEGMRSRSEELLTNDHLCVRIAALEDIFLFKTVAERPDDIDDMATLVQTGLTFEAIEDEVAEQVTLLHGERFTTIISESLGKLDDRHGIQTPLNDTIDEYYERYMRGFELRMALDEDTPRPIPELAAELDVEEHEIEERVEYLERFDAAKQVPDGILDTGKHDRFKRSK
jgi:hypothetical protein